jgi:hypothetical protein
LRRGSHQDSTASKLSGSGDTQNALRRAAMHNLRIHELAKWIDW